MNVETIEISQLSADVANVRTHGESQISKLMASLRRWGQTLPLLVDANNLVRVGNARLEAMLRLSWTKCKIVRMDLSPTEWVALSVADNRLHDESSFDQNALANVLTALRAEDVDMQAVGYTPAELAELLGEQQGADAQPPADFPVVDETISTEHECPKCKYKWSGSSAPQEQTP